MKASAGHDFLICSHTDILRDCLRQASRFHSRWIYFRRDRFFLMRPCFMPPPAMHSAAAQRMHLEPDALDLGGPVRRGDLVNDVLWVDHRKQIVDQRIRDRVVLVDF